MFISFKLNRLAAVLSLIILIISSFTMTFLYATSQKSKNITEQAKPVLSESAQPAKKDFIKWVDFKITSTAMQKAMKLDIESQNTETKLDWIELLAILGSRYGGDFSKFKESDLTTLTNRLKNGETVADITKDMKYYPYYHQAYTAVLDEFVGEYEIQTEKENNEIIYEKKCGFKAFCTY